MPTTKRKVQKSMGDKVFDICNMIFWIIFLIIWAVAGLPIGPGVGMTLPAGIL